MNPADIRALIAVLIRGQHIEIQKISRNDGQVTIDTFDGYLSLAQQILESSWNPNNYKHPAGEDSSRLGVDEAVALLASLGYGITAPTSPDGASTPPQP